MLLDCDPDPNLPRSISTYVLNQCPLVLEGVTLAQVVELVVKVLVDLAAGTVLDEKTAEDSETAHPDNLAVEKNIRFAPHFHPFVVL